MVRKFISKIKGWFTLSQANKERMTIVSLLAVIFICVWAIISIGNWMLDAIKGPDYPGNSPQITVVDSIKNVDHARDV